MTKLWDDYTKKKKATSFPFELLNKYAKGNILDLGCGDGTHAQVVHGLNKGVVYGVDISEFIINKAKNNYQDIKFFSTSVESLPYEDDYFDFIYSIDVIEHLKEPKIMLKEVKRVLKPEGIFVIQTPNYPIKRLYDFYNVFTKKNWRKRLEDDPTHFYKFTAFGLKKMCSGFFRVVDFKTRNIFMQNKIKLLKKLKNKGNLLTVLFGQKTIIVLKK